MWEDILKIPISPEEKRLIRKIEREHAIFAASQKLMRDGAAFILKVHPLIQQLPLASMFPGPLRPLGRIIKNSIYAIATGLYKYAEHRDTKKNREMKSMIKDIIDKLKE